MFVKITVIYTPGPLYNMVRYNTVLDITLITVKPQLDYFLLYLYTLNSCYNTDLLANTEIGLDPINSVIKRLRCTLPFATNSLHIV